MGFRAIQPILTFSILVSGVVTQGNTQTVKPVDPLCQQTLPADAANRLTGRTDLQSVPRRSVSAAGGTCNYAAGGSKMIFLVTILDEKARANQAYARYKGQGPYLAHQADLNDVGDAAFIGGDSEHLLVIRKGTRIIQIASMLELDRSSHQMHAKVSRVQMIAIAKEVVGKLR
jgi:hypothetical protein